MLCTTPCANFSHHCTNPKPLHWSHAARKGACFAEVLGPACSCLRQVGTAIYAAVLVCVRACCLIIPALCAFSAIAHQLFDDKPEDTFNSFDSSFFTLLFAVGGFPSLDGLHDPDRLSGFPAFLC